MITNSSRGWLGILAVTAVAVTSGIGAETPAAKGRAGATAPGTPAASAQRPARGSTAKGPLPDPALLDGSKQTADKIPENGMLGEFELPGDENVKNGKVGGGPQNPNQQAGEQSGGLPQMSGGGGPQSAQNQQKGGGAGGQQQPGGQQPPEGQQGGAAAGGPQDQAQAAGGGAPISGPADPNATAQGIQVAELQGDPSQTGEAGAGGSPAKPGPVAIGDSAMQIKGVQNAPSVVGGQVAGQTQQMEKAVGGSGKGSTSGNNNNRGVEKGRVMPAGL